MSEMEQKQDSASIQRSGFSGMSITAFILSLFGFLLALPAVAGLILGIVSLVRSNRDFRRRGLAIAAVVVSSLWILLFIVIGVANSGSAPTARDDVAVNSPDDALAKLESAGVPCANASTGANPDGERYLFCNLIDGNFGPESYAVYFDKDFRASCGSTETARLADEVVVKGGSWVAGTGEIIRYGNTLSDAELGPVASALGGEVMTLRTFCG